MKKFGLGLAVLIAASALAVAQSNQGNRQTLGGTPSQDRIAREVRHELLLLPYYSVFDNLAYQVNGDTVTLLGQVAHPVLKDDAANAVKHIEGVQKVINNIQVLPTSPMDDQIRRAEFRAIYGYPTFEKYDYGPVPPIHIIVDHGHVTLEGVVDSESDKNVAEIQAKSVPGVFSVTNNLRVEKP